MKRIVWSLVLASALFVAATPEAQAHGSHRDHHAYERHYVVRHGHHYPSWLHHNTDFHRWYRHSHYRNDYHLSWHRLFDIYRYERRYQRSYRHDDHYRRDRHRRQHRHH